VGELGTPDKDKKMFFFGKKFVMIEGKKSK